MRNKYRYIAALLVVLAATGIEAQTYMSALRCVLGDIPVEQIFIQGEAKSLNDDILSVIKTFKASFDDTMSRLPHFPGDAYNGRSFLHLYHSAIHHPYKNDKSACHPTPLLSGSVDIRAPNWANK